MNVQAVMRAWVCLAMTLLAAGGLWTARAASPAPAGWFAGDMHVHRSCGGPPMPVETIRDAMVSKNISVVSLLADMGNGEVLDPVEDLARVTGVDDPLSTSERIIRWDAEWHWDATYTQFPHQALGGHLVALGLTEAYQIWEEHTYPVLAWARQQGGIVGFAHMQYLDNALPQSLNCCIPIEYPIEVALGAADFISEDVSGSESAVQAYYRLLNCGFRPGFAGGSDHPCGAEVGSVLTYSRAANGVLSYRGWIEGIAAGRTVVSRSGHTEFLDLKVEETAGPGDEVQLGSPGSVSVSIAWTALQDLAGTIELVQNGVVVASKLASAGPGTPDSLSATISFARSGWLAARRMNAAGHQLHTAAVFVIVDGAPIRTSAADAQFYVDWADNLIQKTSVGGEWAGFFTTSRDAAQARYAAAKAVYQQVLAEALAQQPLAVATVALPGGAVGSGYSSALAAVGGKTPYTWTISAGALPAGLTLDPSTGVISGTPSVAETRAFTVQVTDAGTPAASASAALSITTYVGGTVATLWPVTTVPSVVDGGPDIPVQLGVKFRSDVAGLVTGIRFYKATANTGTHIGHLWSSTGTLLAAATFTGETASGWQQVTFASPVSISANTTYIASYHCPNGHYSADVNYFASARDNPPLHALASGSSGGNGVYAYGPAGSFPNQTWNAANYWVDVVFASGPPPALSSISVMPVNPEIAVGATQQFTAVGSYSDGSTQDLTSQVVWVSTESGIASINANGVATGLGLGGSTVRATLAGISESTGLTVIAAPLAVATGVLPNGTLGVAYSAALTASGGTPPYAWSLANGTLPAGLSLSSGGVISGTPTAVGSASFTVEVSDSSVPGQSASRALSLTVAPNVVSIWPANAVPTVVDGGADSAVELGVKFRSDVAGTITGIRFYKAAANTGTHVGSLWSSTGTLLASATFTGETASGWQQVSFANPVAVTANTTYVASYRCPSGHYSADVNYFAVARDNPPLHALASGASGGNGVFRYGTPSAFPNQTWNAANYWVDVLFAVAAPPTLNSIAVTPANPSILVGATQQFTATGTYSDGSTQNLTSQAAWSSSANGVATVNGSGLATAVAAGTTTITATVGAVSGNTVLTVTAPPTLVSIAVTPANPTVVVGGTQQFTATGTYSNGSTQNLTSQVGWASSEGAVATVTASGLATAVGPGLTTITATMGGVTGQATLTVPAPAVLEAITVEPVNPTIVAGGTQQFTATGTYSDGRNANLTSQVTWTSSNPSTATVNGVGLGTSVAPGTTTISATFASVSGETLLTVRPPPVAVATAGLPNGTLGVAYSAALTASGGTPPYAWSLANGTLPAGLSLSSGGVISGTPTAVGSASFTVEVSDSSVPGQSASRALSLTVAPNVLSIWPANAVPTVVDGGADSAVELGVKFRSDVAGTITGIRFYKAVANTGTHVGNLWSSTGTLLASATFTGETASGWQQVSFATPVAITANTTYVASYRCPSGHYSADVNYFAVARDNPPLHALASGASGGNGVFRYGTPSAFPNQTWNAANYWVDVLFASGPPPALVSIALSPADPSRAVGATQQFTATGTYSDGSTQNLTSQAAWSSSASGVATVNGSGLATAVATGTATITATVGAVSGNTVLTVTTPPTLVSIAVTPANPTVVVGGTQQLTATGSYSDGSTQNLTAQVAWTSTNPDVATISTTGLAMGVAEGTTTIRATLFSVTGETSLQVEAASLSVLTSTLPDANLGTPYQAALISQGGILPYVWSLSGGTLPPGLALSPVGLISGTPTAGGTFDFTVEVSDAHEPAQVAAKSLSLKVRSKVIATIWPVTAAPANLDSGPDNPVELGVKFRTDVPGNILGIRYYRGPGTTGTHVGSLWTAAGTLLASATFAGETASGWQQVDFATPVPVEANTVYVASYHTPNGHYAQDELYFQNSGVYSPPLYALREGENGGNCVYRFGPGTVFPDLAWRAANYWVDVVFEYASGGPDATAPIILALKPTASARGVGVGVPVMVTFSEPMDPLSINSTTLSLLDSANNLVPGTVTYDEVGRMASLTPDAFLMPGAVYTARVRGGTGGVSDVAGNPLAADAVWSFTTLPSNPYGDGPGGPILVVTDAGNPFTEYYAEILLNEGLNAFRLRDISALSAGELAQYELVVLGEMALTTEEASLLTDWVNGGGNLVAMRPDKKLAPLLGLSDTGNSLSEGYLLMHPTQGPAAGLVAETIQYHGTADLYQVVDATTLATLYSNATTPTTYPAVTVRAVGPNGGQAAAFLYDLARSVIFTRQGNPAWAYQERDGFAPMRSNDLFYGAASFDPQPDWVSLDKVAIPQADEQQRLLANLAIYMTADRLLLPRFWYFPRGLKAVVVMTGDDHGHDGTEGRFAQYFSLDAPGASVEDWETVRSSSYIYAEFSGAMSDAEAAAYQAAGFELGLHVNTGCADYTPEQLDVFFASQLTAWTSFYPSLQAPATHRAHCIAWSGYTTMAEIQFLYGIRLDVNYYYWPPNWVNNRPGLFTGSGLPMRFATAQGQVLDIYQAATQLTDESGQSYPQTLDTLLNRALGPEGYYGAFVANIHTDTSGAPESDAILASALSRGVPIISANQLLKWLDGRNGSSIGSLGWDANTQSFSVSADAAARGLEVMVPVPGGLTVSQVLRNGIAVDHELRTVKGLVYAVAPAATGVYQVVFSP